MKTGKNTQQKPPRPQPPKWVRVATLALLFYAGWVMLANWDGSIQFWQSTYSNATKEFSAETKAFAQTIAHTTADAFVQQMNSGEASLVFLFATWCPHCRNTLPEIESLMAASSFPVHILSLDRDINELAEYMLSRSSDGDVTPMQFLPRAEARKLLDYLKLTGARRAGGIPWMALINSDGKIVAEITGYATKDALLALIEEEGLS